MDRKYIDNEHIVDRYLSGDLTVREAREFEKYCLEHPQFLSSLPIPVRLKTRLAKRPHEDSETGIFQAIPSTATRAAVELDDSDFDADDDHGYDRMRADAGSRRTVLVALGVALIAAVGGLITYAMRADALSKQLAQLQSEMSAAQMQAPGGVQTYRVQPVRGKPQDATLAIGWPNPPQLIELHVDVSEGKFTQFMITMDKDDGTRVMQLRRIARDSNRELRLSLNSSAFEPGDYLMRIHGYNWRGETQEVGWVRLGLQ